MSVLSDQISSFALAPYVYSYPPTAAYRPTQDFVPDQAIVSSDVNVYVHVPFCSQKCTFCGYLTAIATSPRQYDEYVDAVIAEIASRAGTLSSRCVRSVNFGGGTPSLLTVEQFGRIMAALGDANPDLLSTAEEISIEATPESVASDRIAGMRAFGLNRVSVGIQSFEASEIALANRHNGPDVSTRTFDRLRDAGIANVCCDLMHGISGQSLESWKRSVERTVALRPETVELYSTVVIPGTVLARRGASKMDGRDRYACYAYARDALLDAGYAQDSHLRFVIPERGGYFQQRNVFAGQSLLGFGVGARSYVDNVHYRNAHDVRHARQAIARYVDAMRAGTCAVESAAFVSRDESMRRFAIYGIENLDVEAFQSRFGVAFADAFPEQLSDLLRLELAEDDVRRLRLTAKGLAFRDVIAHAFFSEAVS